MLKDRIKKLRLQNEMTQVQLAEIVGVTKQSVSNWENDNIQPSIDMLIKLSKYFSVSTDYLLGMDNRKYLEITHLTDEQLSHLKHIIDDMSNPKKS